MIKTAYFTSVWDGICQIQTLCKVNTSTQEIFNIQSVACVEALEHLDYEYVTIDDKDYKVIHRCDTDTMFYL